MEFKNKVIKNKETNPKKSNKIKKVSIILGLVLFLLIPLTLFISNSYEGQNESQKALVSDENVDIIISDIISFKPVKTQATQGLILFQGAKVDAKAYAPIANQIAKNGYEVYIIDSIFDIPLLASKKADKIINENPSIKSWVIGGHSLGGVVASKVASENPQIQGLVLLASYPVNDSLLNQNKKVLSIWGSKDGILNFKSFSQSKSKLPIDTKFIEIQGANHSQFGDYGLQENDNISTIENEKVLEIVVNNILQMFNDIKNTL